MDYRYEHFKAKLSVGDMSFLGGPQPGNEVPDFDLPTTDEGRLRKRDFLGRPVLMAFGSVT